MSSDKSLAALSSLTLEFSRLIQSLEAELAGFSDEKEAEVSAALAERLDSLATTVYEAVARFAAVVEIEEKSASDQDGDRTDSAESALRTTEAYQEAYGQLEVLAATFSSLQSATATSQRASEAEAGATRRRYNAAQRYLDASKH